MSWITVRPVLDDIRKDLFFLSLGALIGGCSGYKIASEYHTARYEIQMQRIYENIRERDESKLEMLEGLIK